MSDEKLKILETYKQKAMIPFDSTESRIAFTLENNRSGGVRMNVSWKLLLAITCGILYLYSLICFLCFEANTFVEFSDTFYPIATIFVGFFSCTHQIIVRSKSIQLIDNFEMMIEKRKSILYW